MSILESFRMALTNIISNKVRSFLTMLGIIIGVASVMVIVAFGDAQEEAMRAMFANYKMENITVTMRGRPKQELTVDDMYEIVDGTENLVGVSPIAGVSGEVKIGTKKSENTQIQGVNEDYLPKIMGRSVIAGRNLLYIDMLKRSNVCVIGAYVSSEYFAGGGVGELLKIGGVPFTVVGVQEAIDVVPQQWGDDNTVLIPYTVAARMGGGKAGSYKIAMKDTGLFEATMDSLNGALTDFFGSANFFSVDTMKSYLDDFVKQQRQQSVTMAVVAAISLLVGGIGIMNIMLVSVTERTREIGIRKSLGAKERYVLTQFVIESATTSAIGGILGIAFGLGLAALATKYSAQLMGQYLEIVPSTGAILIASGISVGIGILFGFLPARKAAGLNPIDALHYE